MGKFHILYTLPITCQSLEDEIEKRNSWHDRNFHKGLVEIKLYGSPFGHSPLQKFIKVKCQ